MVGVLVPRPCAGCEVGLPPCSVAFSSKIIFYSPYFYSPYLVFEIITDIIRVIYKIFKMHHL